jgi:hypothetical protein
LAQDWGAPPVTVAHQAGKWVISGTKNNVSLDEKDLSIVIQAGKTTWRTVASSTRDLLVRSGGREFLLRLADAADLRITPWKTGFSAGVKIAASGFPNADLKLTLAVTLEGGDEDLVFEVAAVEREAVIRELNWPPAMDGRDIDSTVLSNDDGTLLPREWPKPYHPIRRAEKDTSIIQSNLIECWSMSWWGFLKGDAAMIVIVETPDDAAYTFSHPAGGPTSIGPTWRPQLGRFGYLRSLRMAFLHQGNYVDLAKRYRRYVIDSGLFVPLKDKVARNPLVKNLIGTPFAGASVLRNVKPGGPRYDKKEPKNNHRLTTFAQNAERLRQLKAKGLDRLNVSLSGWPNLGYDRQHPDGLPPNQEGGGWEGMKAFFDACRELGYTCWLHDQYRDYYPDAPSYNLDLAVREEDAASPPKHFPGTRFHPHDWKEGAIPFMNYWDGGTQAYLNNRYMLGHMQKNYRLMAQHGIRPQGSYNDVFGYIPPDEDFNPEHPCTRTESMRYRAAAFHWTRANLGVVGTEDAADWTIPYVDYATSRFNRNPGSGNDASIVGAIEVPLYELVYHDAIVTTGGVRDLRSALYGNAPLIGRGDTEADVGQVRMRAALHQRIGMSEMVNHEFLDSARRRERTTFADGTTVTVDWDAKTLDVKPELAVTGRAAWMPKARWGVMTHYLADWIARTHNIPMSPEAWNKLVDGFDVEGIANQLQAVGAGYYIITAGQNSGYYLSPNSAYDKLTGAKVSKCSRRDLIADLYEALSKRGIRLIVYLPSGAPVGDADARARLQWQNRAVPNREFQLKWEEVIREWGSRWGGKVGGWWFDGCYFPNSMYRSAQPPNFESFAAAARAGNPGRAIAFNPGVVPRLLSVTPHEDYTAGEISDPAALTIRRHVDGKVDGAQIHVLSYLGKTWGMGDQPRFTTDQALQWSRMVREAGGAITWDVPVQLDGTMSQPFMEQLSALGRAFAGAASK